ncbi:MAG: acetyl-CoA carboxylase, carboxyltransferase subunit beta [Mariprofundales bacterium]
MNWLTRLIEGPKTFLDKARSTPENLWIKCDSCGETLYHRELTRAGMVCSKCEYHFRLSASERADFIFTEYMAMDLDLHSEDVLGFKDQKRYRDRLRDAGKKAGTEDSVHNYLGMIGTHEMSVSIFNFPFMGGSMGSVAGEKITLAMERAIEKNIPYLLITASGGARMQEGLNSLMQMAKTSATVNLLNNARLPFICLLTDPTMGGVSASVAWLGDIIIAEPAALIGFAGPRVIQETVGGTLPEGFQRAEFLLEHGLIDDVIARDKQVQYLDNICNCLMYKQKLDQSVNDEQIIHNDSNKIILAASNK